MSLLKDFYSLIDHPDPLHLTEPPGIVKGRKLTVRLNPDHSLYPGHFPGNPVVPGVCQIQMILELAGLIINKPVKLDHADNIKFLSLIVPEQNPILDFEFSIRESAPEKILLSASIQSGETVFLKFKGSFSLI